MIYTLTLNPALDYIVTVPDYKEGGINRTSGELFLPGGKGINVSAVLNNLGVKNRALGYLSGFTGGIILKMLESMGVDTDFIELADGFSRINVKIKAQQETEINGMGPRINNEEQDMLFKRLGELTDGDMIVLAGSVPNTLPETFYYDVIKSLEGKAVDVIVDATGKLLSDALPLHPFLIKPNDIELGELFGKELKSDSEIIEGAKKLQEQGARNVLVSMGKRGAILVSEEGNILKGIAPDGKAVNTTGAGDSMVAGFIAGYKETGDLSYALRLGVAAGSASAFSERLATCKGVEEYLNAVIVEEYTS